MDVGTMILGAATLCVAQLSIASILVLQRRAHEASYRCDRLVRCGGHAALERINRDGGARPPALFQLVQLI